MQLLPDTQLDAPGRLRLSSGVNVDPEVSDPEMRSASTLLAAQQIIGTRVATQIKLHPQRHFVCQFLECHSVPAMCQAAARIHLYVGYVYGHHKVKSRCQNHSIRTP